MTSCGSAVAPRTRVRRSQQLRAPASRPTNAAPQSADAPRPHERERADEPPAGDAAGLALRLDRRRLVELEGAARCRDRALADEDLARAGRLLEPCGDVDGVAGHERAALPRPADDDLAGVHADAQRERVAEELVEPPLHREGGVQRALRVVLVRGRSAERRHHRVADELLDAFRPAPSISAAIAS